jgi:uncharacterized lipoprotein YbaY
MVDGEEFTTQPSLTACQAAARTHPWMLPIHTQRRSAEAAAIRGITSIRDRVPLPRRTSRIAELGTSRTSRSCQLPSPLR